LFRTVAGRVGFAVVLAGALTLALATTAFRGGSIHASLASSSDVQCGYGGGNCEDLFQTGMTAKQVVPPPGQVGAQGYATINLNEEAGKVCTNLNIKGVTGPVTGVSIHKGLAGKTGAIVVNFGGVTVSSAGTASKCKTGVAASLMEAIEANPPTYYMTVNTKSHPAGAVRGQLAHQG
jgi:hypothetical protein